MPELSTIKEQSLHSHKQHRAKVIYQQPNNFKLYLKKSTAQHQITLAVTMGTDEMTFH